MILLSGEPWGEGVDAKEGRTKRKTKVERLNYTSCSEKDRRGVGSVALKANVAICGANGRRKQGSLNRAYQTMNKDTNREPVTAYHCAFETVDRTENNQGEKPKRKTKRRQAYKGHTEAACERHTGVCSSPKTRWKEHGIEEKLRNEI